jgi:hypothetical protein
MFAWTSSGKIKTTDDVVNNPIRSLRSPGFAGNGGVFFTS